MKPSLDFRCSLLAATVSVLTGLAHAQPIGQPASPLDSTGPAAAQSLLADAGVRASLEPGQAGYRSGFRIDSADERFSLRVNGIIQFRYFATFDADRGADDDREGGFQFRRTRLDFRGHIGSPDLTFRVQTEFGRSDGSFELVDAYFQRTLGENLSLRVGQYKVPFDREFSIISGSTPQLLDRSVVSDVFRFNRSQGVTLDYRGERSALFLTASEGRNSEATLFTDTAEADYALTARAELRLGEAPWSQHRDLNGFRGNKTGGLLGAGLHWQQDGATSAPGDSGQMFAYTADAGAEGDGWSVFTTITGRVVEANDQTIHDYGLVLQGGVFVTERTELAGRVSYTVPDPDRATGDDPFPEFAIAATYYIIPNSHTFKVTAMLTWLPEAQADSSSIVRAPNTSVGFLPDSSGGQVLLGLGVQLRF